MTAGQTPGSPRLGRGISVAGSEVTCPTQVQPVPFGAVFTHHLKTGINKDMVALGKMENGAGADGKNLLLPAGDVTAVCLGICYLFQVIAVAPHSQHFRDHLVLRRVIEMDRLPGLGGF